MAACPHLLTLCSNTNVRRPEPLCECGSRYVGKFCQNKNSATRLKWAISVVSILAILLVACLFFWKFHKNDKNRYPNKIEKFLKYSVDKDKISLNKQTSVSLADTLVDLYLPNMVSGSFATEGNLVPVEIRNFSGTKDTDNCGFVENIRNQNYGIKSHFNVLKFYGICYDTTWYGESLQLPLRLVLNESMDMGSVFDLLVDTSKNVNIALILSIASQTVNGITHLESEMKFKHRLNTKDLFLNSHFQVKIAGTKDLAYFSNSTNRLNHVTKFAKLVLEMFARKPIYSSKSKTLKNLLISKPSDCPMSVYILCLRCFTDVHNLMPTFDQISEALANFQNLPKRFGFSIDDLVTNSSELTIVNPKVSYDLVPKEASENHRGLRPGFDNACLVRVSDKENFFIYKFIRTDAFSENTIIESDMFFK